MLHAVEGDTRGILQVEINTISSSFGSLSTKIAKMHSLLTDQVDTNIPPNVALSTITQSLAYAHSLYLETQATAQGLVVMVVQPAERNFADQRLIQFELLEKYNVTTVRLTLAEIHHHCSLDDQNGALLYQGRPVSVVYVSYCII